MYKLTVDGVCSSTTFELIVHDVLKPDKLFINDVFDDSKIIFSPTRNELYIPGVLDLRKTYGKEGKKFLYLCRPDDKRLPYFYIAYDIPYHFEKKKGSLYITFQFKTWTKEFPIGTITQNLGGVETSAHFYEYMLYCKSLNVSIQSFTKEAQRRLKDYVPSSDIQFRNARVFTIDSYDSIDLDDALSVDDEKVSVYITHVPYIIDRLGLWNSFTNRISTIYLPDKKRSMLPPSLSNMCSLNEGNERVCMVLDLYNSGRHEVSVTRVKIHKNFAYEDKNLLGYTDYQRLLDLTGCKNSHDVVAHYMIKFNTILANMTTEGIYKQVNKPDAVDNECLLPAYYQYSSSYEYKGEYLQASSPIRRLVDVLNMYQLTKQLNLTSYTDDAVRFYHHWYNQIDYLNRSMKQIKSLQNKCKLLDQFEKGHHQVFEGYVFEKEPNVSGLKDKYMVYIPDLKLINPFYSNSVELAKNQKYKFTIYVFHDEDQLKKKVRLQLSD